MRYHLWIRASSLKVRVFPLKINLQSFIFIYLIFFYPSCFLYFCTLHFLDVDYHQCHKIFRQFFFLHCTKIIFGIAHLEIKRLFTLSWTRKLCFKMFYCKYKVSLIRCNSFMRWMVRVFTRHFVYLRRYNQEILSTCIESDL